ncbi:5536_t:CDS:2, partial [Dentiscutata heterogama]
CQYHKLLLQNRIATFDESNLTNQPPDPVTIYNAIQFVSQAWNKVSEDVIIHSWQKTGILYSTEIDEFMDSESLNNYTIGKMLTVKDIIAKIQENESEEEPERQIKPVTAIQAITELDSVLGYIEQPESSFKIDIKVFSELKQI